MDELSTPINGEITLTKASRDGGPVTCVSLPRTTSPGGSVVLWARGPYLQRQHLQRQEEEEANNVEQLLVFPRGGTIHGIRHVKTPAFTTKNCFDAVLFGGRQLSFCNVREKASSMNRLDVLDQSNISTGDDCQITPQLVISDWIWDVEALDRSDDGDISKEGPQQQKLLTLVIGLARHMVEIWQVQSKGITPTMTPFVTTIRQRRINASVSCLVTSMHLLSCPKALWIAAGTAFHKIHVWSIGHADLKASTASQSLSTPQQHQCLKGHAGVVHSVQFSADGLSLASTSDDRSVRFWKYNEVIAQWSQLWVGWGHSARVWSVSLAPGSVLSTGEDGTTRIWSLSSGHPLASIQHSCSLWTLDCRGNSVVVGATDGTIAFYDLSTRVPGDRLVTVDAIPVPDDRPEQPLLTTLDDTTQTNNDTAKDSSRSNLTGLQISKKKKKGASKAHSQVIVGLKWSERARDKSMGLLLATRAGSLMSLHDAQNNNREWEKLNPWWEPVLQDSHNILASEGCCMAVQDSWTAIGTTRGDVVLASISSVNQPIKRVVLCARNLKSVQGLVWVNASTLVSFHVRSVAWWSFDSSKDLQGLQDPFFILNLGTKGVPMSCAYDKKSSRIIVGDSRGNLGLFHLNNSRGNPGGPSCVLEADSLLERLHQKEHVTAICIQGNRIISAGNDGRLHTSYIHGTSLRKGWSLPAKSMTGVSQIWNSPCQLQESTMFVAGYYGNIFRLIDPFTGHEFFSMDTGGRQRIHDCVVCLPTQGYSTFPSQYGMVVCMNQKDGTNSLMIRQLSQSKEEAATSPFKFQHGVCMHGETIFSTCLFSLGVAQDSMLLLTGSEDCTSKISLYKNHQLVDSISLTPQESCVRAVCCSQIDDNSALLVVGGGKLTLQFFLSRFDNERGLSRMQDLEISYLGKGANRVKATIDHRINAVKAVPLQGSNRSHLVVAGDSDGNCHLFIVAEDSKLRPFPSLLIPTSSRPILCIDVLPVGARLLVVMGTTGEEVLLFDLPGLAPELHNHWDTIVESWFTLSSYKAHQMGVNAITAFIRSTAEREGGMTASISICTGGDDQAICICGFSLMTENRNKLRLTCDALCPLVTKEVSFSAIKGIFQFGEEGRRFLATVGYSQQLALWQLLGDEKNNLQLADKMPVDLGDVNCLAGCMSGREELLLAVGGMGVETMVLRTM